MFKNYLKITLRNIRKNPGYSGINIFGLAIGITVCLLIAKYVVHELSYDKHHANADRIYRVISKIDFSGRYMEMAATAAPMGPTLLHDFPEVEAAARFRSRGSYLVRHGNANFKEEKVVFADASVFEVFTMPMLQGNPQTALTNPNTVVITQAIAEKYFNKTDAVGETLILDNERQFEVTGVIANMPSTSHFHFDFLLSMATIDEAESNVWVSHNFKTYILLNEGADPQAFERNLDTIKKQYVAPQIMDFMGLTMAEFEEAGNSVDYDLQPLTSIHLYSDLTGEFEPNGSITYVYIFSVLAVFVLLLACINFMNLATARSSKRAREVGVRKTLGSARYQLTIQFLAESVMLSFIAFVIALLMVELIEPFFSQLAGRDISSSFFSNAELLGWMSLIVLMTGLLAGSYPALMLSSFKPVRVLKGTFTEQWGHSFLRKGLVVFQFAISLVIIVGLLVINKQLNFIHQKELGFKKDQIVIVQDAYALGDIQSVETYKQEMLDSPIFKAGTISSFFPVQGFGRDSRTYWPKGQEPSQNNTVSMQRWTVDEDYIPMMEMEIIRGRNFDDSRKADANTVILNESAARQFGFENPIGKVITIYGSGNDGSINKDILLEYKIVGIVKDFHYESLRKTISPLGLFYGPSRGNVAFKLAASNSARALAQLKNQWEQQVPNQPFNYTFMDQQFDQMYRAESRVQDLMTAFSVLAMVIACLGLFGLSAYSAERRTKEIGIRKVMGATVPNILTLISGEFLKLVGISFVIAIPLSYWIMSRWLQDFAYRTVIGIDVFLMAGLGAFLVAVVTVSWQSIKAALMNPVKSLRSE